MTRQAGWYGLYVRSPNSRTWVRIADNQAYTLDKAKTIWQDRLLSGVLGADLEASIRPVSRAENARLQGMVRKWDMGMEGDY